MRIVVLYLALPHSMNTELHNEMTRTTDLNAVHDRLVDDVVKAIVADHPHHHHKDDAATSAMIGKPHRAVVRG